MNKLRILLVSIDKECKNYEPAISLTVADSTTVKDVKIFLKFYLNYHQGASLKYENIIIEHLDDSDTLVKYVKDSTEVIIKYSLHV